MGPRTATELLLAEVWRDLLGVASVSVHDNFFDLGGHSLLSMRALAAVEKKTGKRLNPREYIFQTLEQVARSYDRIDEPELTTRTGVVGLLLGAAGARAGRSG